MKYNDFKEIDEAFSVCAMLKRMDELSAQKGELKATLKVLKRFDYDTSFYAREIMHIDTTLCDMQRQFLKVLGLKE